MGTDPEIKKSPDDWGYILLDSKGVKTRVWAMPSNGKKCLYDIYRLDRAEDLLEFGYFRVYEEVTKSKVDESLREILGD